MPHSRRYRTAKRIQLTAVNLAIEKGLHNITTEEISLAAGISPRTFFNYYPYKEAALLGLAVSYPQAAVDKFVHSKNNLLEDLQALIAAHLNSFQCEHALIKNLICISASEPKLKALMNDQIVFRRDELTEILARRLPDTDIDILYILSSATFAAISRAVLKWTSGADEGLLEIASDRLALIIPTVDLLR